MFGKTKTTITALALCLAASACTVQLGQETNPLDNEPTQATPSLVPSTRVEQPGRIELPPQWCEVQEQDHDACLACGDPIYNATWEPAGDDFDSCYDHPNSGAEVCDGSACAELHPESAKVWLKIVDNICNSCAAECCFFCASRWGCLAP